MPLFKATFPCNFGHVGHCGHVLKLSTILKFYKKLGFVVVCDIPPDAFEDDDEEVGG